MDSQGMGGEPAPLSIYRLIPTATRSDRRFARDAFHGEIVVRACSPSDARRVASEAEAASLEGPPPEGSPFHDPTLYSVIEVAGAGLLRPGKRGVVTGRFSAKPVAG
jgi:hypothetical protein